MRKLEADGRGISGNFRIARNLTSQHRLPVKTAQRRRLQTSHTMSPTSLLENCGWLGSTPFVGMIDGGPRRSETQQITELYEDLTIGKVVWRAEALECRR
jgi:hypothetical protein